MSDSGKAVFLSYASQDADAARRICEALRAAGVEVWFDQSELRGGDAWDAMIRKRIKECALFVPVISANTQARAEGYFRLEWKLADRRTDLIGKSKALLLPVCIDDTRDADADVPDSFLAVQWTRLRGGETPPAFVARVQGLLSKEAGPISDRPSEKFAPSEAGQRPAQSRKRRPWLVPVVGGAVVAALALALMRPWEKLRSLASSLPSPTSGERVMARLSPARELVAKSARLHDQLGNASRGDLQLAEQFCQQAVALDPNDAEVWAEYSLVISNYIAMGYDRSGERVQAARRHAEKAVKLAPDSLEAQFALATSYRWQAATRDEAIRLLRGLVDRMPGDRRVLRTLGNALRLADQSEEALLWYDRAAKLPGGDPLALFQRAMALDALGRNQEAVATLDESLALHPAAAAYILKVFYLLWSGELEAARSALDKVPGPFLVEERGALAASTVYSRQRQWDQCLGVLQALPQDYIDDAFYRGPKGLLTGNARFHAGRKLAAEEDWRSALRLVDQRLAAGETSPVLHLRKAELHARLGQADQADQAFRTFHELSGGVGFYAKALIDVYLNRNEAVLQSLQGLKPSLEVIVRLRQEPDWDSLRGDPRFQALLADSGSTFPSALSLPASTLSVADSKSVAVLAFANLSDDKANEYFSDGISEELLNVLAKVPGLKVTARTSAFHFKGKDTSIPEIARQLGVAYVVEGSVRKQGERVRITAQLIKAADGFHVWSDTFTRDLKDIFAVQDEIAGLIAQALSLKLGASGVSGASVKPEAYRLYLEGRNAWRRRTFAGYDEANGLFERALALEPDFALAHAGIADVEITRAQDENAIGRFNQRDAPALHRIGRATRRALDIGPGLAEAHAARGSMYWMGWKFDEATRALRTAIGLNPNYATAHQWLGRVLMADGRLGEALAELEQAHELDPLSPRIADNYSMTLIDAQRYEEALAMAEHALAIQPDSVQALAHKAVALAELGRNDEAVATAQQGGGSGNNDYTIATFSYALARAGAREQAEQMLAAASAKARLPFRAATLLALGRAEEALVGLEAGAVPAQLVDWLYFWPVFDPVRGDPRFVQVLAELGVTEAHDRAQAWRALNPPRMKKPPL